MTTKSKILLTLNDVKCKNDLNELYILMSCEFFGIHDFSIRDRLGFEKQKII
jgi:hypothetical protein